MGNFQEYWQSRVRSPAFRQRVRELHEKAWAEFLSTPMLEMLQVVEWQIQKFPLDPSWHSAFDKMGRDIHDMVSARIKERDKAPQEVLSPNTIALWRKFVGKPLELDEETVSTLVDAPAVRELFVTIIHDSIIEFNRKFNPFFGGLTALGLDKQIREFITPFMGHITELAKNFILNPANRAKIGEFQEIAFDLVVRQKPAFFYNLSSKEGDELFIQALHETFRDQELKEFVLEIFRKYRLDVEAKHGQKSLKDYLAENGIHPTPPVISDEELDFYLKKAAESPTLLWFLQEEFELYQK
ncbi:MAG: hypothetical protein NZM25_01900 [Leptospiraceae bacterium]|nr:hypothetical protein [Leptospiraceae bacterium]MDW8306929.1 hypothetical protein [Leptospiraceae bacterium]